MLALYTYLVADVSPGLSHWSPYFAPLRAIMAISQFEPFKVAPLQEHQEEDQLSPAAVHPCFTPSRSPVVAGSNSDSFGNHGAHGNMVYLPAAQTELDGQYLLNPWRPPRSRVAFTHSN
jgi:hypothetical protein